MGGGCWISWVGYWLYWFIWVWVVILATYCGGCGFVWCWVWFNMVWVLGTRFGCGLVVIVGLGRWLVGLGVKFGNALKYWVGL